TSHLRISADAHLVAPYHQTLDKVTERFLGKRAIGTTGRGIGPTYQDKVARLGIRVQDLFDESILCQKIEGALRQKNELLVKLYNRRAFTVDEIVEYFQDFTERLRPMVVDSVRSIGTTGRGTGPTYQDKVARLGIRVQDLFDESILCQKIEGALRQKNELLVKLYNRRAFTVDEIVEYFQDFTERLRPMVVDSVR